MRFVIAVPVGWTLLLALCAAGIGALVVAVPSLRWVIKALGIVYLLWLAWKLSGSATLGQADGEQLQGRLQAGRDAAVPQHQGLAAGADAGRGLDRRTARCACDASRSWRR